MPQVASVTPPDARPPISARDRNDAPSDGFSQLLQSVGGNDPQDDRAEQNDAPAPAQQADRGRHAADRTSRNDDDTQSVKSDKSTDKPDTDDSGVAVKGKQKNADDASSDDDGKSKNHKHKDKADAVADGAVQAVTTTSATATANTAVAATIVPVVSADADKTVEGAQGEEAVQPLTPSQNSQTAATPDMQASKDAETALAAGNASANKNAKAAAKGAAKPAPQMQQATEEDSAVKPVADKSTQSAGKGAIATGLRASIDVAAAIAPKVDPTQSQSASASLQDTLSISADSAKAAPENTNTAAKAETDTKADASNTASTSHHETLESALSKHFSSDIHVTNDAQIALQDASRPLTNNITSVNLSAPTQASAADSPPVPLQNAALAIEIASRAKDGSRQFDIRLDPPELGRIDVKLDVDKNGQVNTHLTVDRPETLDLLRRDSQGLERALQQAGLKTSDSGLEFSLRQQTPDGSAFNDRNQSQQNARGGGNASGDVEQTAVINTDQYQWAARLRGGVDIRV